MLKLDVKVALWACVMFFALQLDRGNIIQALSTDFLSMYMHLQSQGLYLHRTINAN